MRRSRLALLATLVAVGVAGSAYAATGGAQPTVTHGGEQARAAEIAPSTPRDALLAERSTATLRRLASDRGEHQRDGHAVVLAVLACLALVALEAGRRLHRHAPHVRRTVVIHGITARGPPLRLA
jgi:hypothetical protein